MSDVRERYSKLFDRGKSTERLVFFSDAVFAIALTLLVIDIRIPPFASDSETLLGEKLLELIPQFIAYALSFAIIAVNWISHHRKFRAIKEYDQGLIWINFCLLLFVAFLPFPTSLISEFSGERPAVILYAAEIAAISLSQWWLWSYAYRKKLTAPEIDLATYRQVRTGVLITPVVFLLSIPVALIFGGYVAMMSWWVLIIADRAVFGISDAVGRRRKKNPAASA